MWVRSDSDRSLWTVNRRWLPWRSNRVLRRAAGRAADGAVLSGPFEEMFLGALIGVVALVALCALLVVLVAEWFIMLALVPILLLVRLSGFFPWVIMARRWDGLSVREVYSGEAKGWVSAWHLVRTVKREIRDTGVPRSLLLRAPDA